MNVAGVHTPARISAPLALVGGALILLAFGAAAAQTPPTPFVGTGPYPTNSEPIPSLPTHTLYRPRDLGALKGAKLPILAWANGDCVADNSQYRAFLTEIASHGYLIVALGPWTDKPAAKPATPPPGVSPTQPAQLIEGVKWAQTENARKGSQLEGLLAVDEVAVMGQSCGGVEALDISPDPLVKTSVIWNSGIHIRDTPDSRIKINKDKLKALHAPIAYFIGGPGDIAYANATDDYARIDRVPVMMANLPLGHMGNYNLPMGGPFAPVGVAWLDWRLKGDQKAKAVFVGPHCGLCGDPAWTIQSKRLDELR